jgi:multicomponent Na+:H+ antiporter subunit B
MILLTAAALFIQGHQLPGGGFIGGVMTVCGFALLYIVFSIDYVEARVLQRQKPASNPVFDHSIQNDYTKMMTAGLLLTLGTGSAATALGEPFLTHGFTKLHGLPVYGELEVASAVAFDLGVYLVVVGGLMAALSVVGEQ